MPKIFELFGYPVSVQTPKAQQCRKNAQCPFMGGDCDGGGNRYASSVALAGHKQLKTYFGNRDGVVSGICSIQLKNGEAPWIVCPRRLLILGREKANARGHQKQTETEVLRSLGYSKGTTLGVWSELKLQFKGRVRKIEKSFNYAFDYIVMPIGRVNQNEIVTVLGGEWAKWRRVFENAGYSIARRGEEDFVEDCPTGTPSIIEVMTCSTSGGNKAKGTTIPQAFEAAILGQPCEAPGINKRQVWARMVSQLIVKSEVALAWGGKTLWIVQDMLADYITTSTALDLQQFVSQHLSEVNLLSFSYGNQYTGANDVIELKQSQLFAGPISSSKNTSPSFQDMIRAPVKPTLSRLLTRLAESKPINKIQVP